MKGVYQKPLYRPGALRVRSLSALSVVALLLATAAGACGDSSGPTDPDDSQVPALAAPPPDAAQVLATITAENLTTRIGMLAHDSMMGRWTPSPELVKAARYIAAEFARLGLDPVGGDDAATCDIRDVPDPMCPYLQWFSPDNAVPPDAMNVLAVLPGSDADLRDEYVILGAHFDHIGTGVSVSGDSVYNGADDNASGTSAVLELAEAYTALDTPPRRSVLFILFAGEERGLLGSWHFAQSPQAPTESTVAMVNLDMIGRNWTNGVAGISQLTSDIFERSDRVADAHPELDMDLVSDPWPEQNLLNRSDQAPFTIYGVPVLFLTSGLHDDYHHLSDEADKIDYEKTARLTRLVFWLLWEFAETTQPPGFLQ